MKRKELIKKLDEAAKANGLRLEFVREGANHSLYRIGTWQFPIVRHNEIVDVDAKSLLKRAAAESPKEKS